MTGPHRGSSFARLPSVAVALLIVLFALVPVAGLVLGLGGRTTSPASLLPPSSLSLGELIVQSGALRLAGNTLLLAVAVTSAALVLGTALAWFEQRSQYRGRRVLAALALVPLAVPSYLLAGTLREVLGPGGWIGRPLGFGVFTGIVPAIVVLTLVCTPYVHLLVGAALRRMSIAEEEAARNLGAGEWRCFRSIVLPRLGPSLSLGGILVVLYVFGDFGAVAVLDCPVLNWRIFRAYETQNLARAAVLGLTSLGLVVPFLAVGMLLQRSGGSAAGVANPRIDPGRPLGGRAATFAWAVHLPIVGLGVVVPLITLAQWVRVGWSFDEPFASVASPLLQTLALSAGGALIIVSLGALPAWISARRPAGWGWFVDQAVYLSGALPGILVATGLFLVALSLQRAAGAEGAYLALRQAGVLLFAGYAMRYLSQGFGGLKSAVLRLDPRQEECARSLGAGAWRCLRRVTLPALAPGVAATYLLLFLVLLRELPITLVLQPIGFQTLSFRIFDRYQEAFLHDAGLAGIVLVALALGGQALTLRWRSHV